jgi:putative phosphoesterase
MRIAAIYDIHGNLPALEAVLADVRRAGVDRIIVGGDVLPGPMPRETIDRLTALDIPVDYIRGNGDRAALEHMTTGSVTGIPAPYRDIFRWVGEQLGPADEKLIASWPAMRRHHADGIGDVLFCHATPRNDTEIFTRETPEAALRPVFADANAALVVCGHTHMQFDRTIAGKRVLNSGSVGMPFGEPGAYWALLGPTVELRCTSYDLQEAARIVRGSGYPQAEEFASKNILTAPTEAAMLATFAGVALR